MKKRQQFRIPSNRSIPLPVRRARIGEKVAIFIRNIPYTVCSDMEKEFVCSIPRKQLECAGYKISGTNIIE